LKYNRWFKSVSRSLRTVFVHNIVVELPSVFSSHCYDCPMCGPDFPTVVVVNHKFIKWVRHCEQLFKFIVVFRSYTSTSKICMFCTRPVLWTCTVLSHST